MIFSLAVVVNAAFFMAGTLTGIILERRRISHALRRRRW